MPRKSWSLTQSDAISLMDDTKSASVCVAHGVRIGGVGVSGASDEQDDGIATAAIAALAKRGAA